MDSNQCVTELMARTCVDWPFLSECVNPILAIPEPLKALNVLHDSELLIVGFLNQEAVVLDRWWRDVGERLLAKTAHREEARRQQLEEERSANCENAPPGQ